MIGLDTEVTPKDTAMLRDDSNDGPGRRRTPRNVLGEPLEACSIKPMTGFYRARLGLMARDAVKFALAA